MGSETPSSLSCMKCGAPISLRAPGLTLVIACPSCGALNDVTNPNIAFLIKANQKTPIKPLIPLGRRGKMEEILYEVIGFMRRSDASGIYTWDEYLLFNPYYGFRWLMEYKGHWIFYKMIKDNIEITPYSAIRKKVAYKRFLVGKAKVQYVLGEFYWRVQLGDTTKVYDYIAPPEILSCEEDGSEKIWSHGIYVEPKEIQAAFQTTFPLPKPIGVGACQPGLGGKSSDSFWLVFILFFILLTFVQISSSTMCRDEEVWSSNNLLLTADTDKVKTSPSFHLNQKIADVKISSHASLQNNWIYLNLDLINEDDGKIYPMGREISFYDGYDDGYWSEGSTHDEVFISSVPEGNYHLVISPEFPADLSNEIVDIKIERDAPNWTNYVIFSLLLLVGPLGLQAYKMWFESKRWQESDLPG
ncbi:MAG: DUF4178 domain-containing protein [Deltaproteobacteria bacterium]|nr:DUF4178 domain-containing protein [Deltaproteobacteria bacterium]